MKLRSDAAATRVLSQSCQKQNSRLEEEKKNKKNKRTEYMDSRHPAGAKRFPVSVLWQQISVTVFGIKSVSFSSF